MPEDRLVGRNRTRPSAAVAYNGNSSSLMRLLIQSGILILVAITGPA